MSPRLVALLLTVLATAGQAAEQPVFVRTPVLRGAGSVAETVITGELMTAASLLLTASSPWNEWPHAPPAACVSGCWLLDVQCAGGEVQRCDVVVTERPSGRQATAQLSVRALAPATDVAQALVLQAAYLLEKLRQAPPADAPVARDAPTPVPAAPADALDVSAGPSLVTASGLTAWGVEAAVLFGLSSRTFVRVSAGYSGLGASSGSAKLDYFHAIPVTASLGLRGIWTHVTATASLGLLVIPVFASSDRVPDSDLAVTGCVEFGVSHRLSQQFWLGAVVRPYYGTGDVTLGEAGAEPFIFPKWGVMSAVQLGARL